jgi:hypothetical protein
MLVFAINKIINHQNDFRWWPFLTGDHYGKVMRGPLKELLSQSQTAISPEVIPAK